MYVGVHDMNMSSSEVISKNQKYIELLLIISTLVASVGSQVHKICPKAYTFTFSISHT